MPDKNPKNLKRIKEPAEENHEEIKEWKHETPAEKQETHKHEEEKRVFRSKKRNSYCTERTVTKNWQQSLKSQVNLCLYPLQSRLLIAKTDCNEALAGVNGA